MIPPKDAFTQKDVRHGGAYMVEVESTYIPHERIPLEFFEGEFGHGELDVEWNIYKHVPPQDAKDPKPSWPYIVFFLLSLSCHCYFIFVISFMILGMAIDHTFVDMHVGMDQKQLWR